MGSYSSITSRSSCTSCDRQSVHDKDNLSPGACLSEVWTCRNSLRCKRLCRIVGDGIGLARSHTCGVDAGGGLGTASAPKAIEAALSGVTGQCTGVRPNVRSDLMD